MFLAKAERWVSRLTSKVAALTSRYVMRALTHLAREVDRLLCRIDTSLDELFA